MAITASTLQEPKDLGSPSRISEEGSLSPRSVQQMASNNEETAEDGMNGHLSLQSLYFTVLLSGTEASNRQVRADLGGDERQVT